MNKIPIKIKDELNQEIEKYCNLYLESDEVDISELKLWKMIGTLDISDSDAITEDSISKMFSCLRLKYTAKGDIWLGDPFNIAIISFDSLEELAVFVSPDCSELYSINNYEDILELLNIEFLPKLKEVINVFSTLKQQGTTSIAYPNDVSIFGNKIWYDGSKITSTSISPDGITISTGVSNYTINSDLCNSLCSSDCNCMDAVTITGNLTLSSDGNWKIN